MKWTANVFNSVFATGLHEFGGWKSASTGSPQHSTLMKPAQYSLSYDSHKGHPHDQLNFTIIIFLQSLN